MEIDLGKMTGRAGSMPIILTISNSSMFLGLRKLAHGGFSFLSLFYTSRLAGPAYGPGHRETCEKQVAMIT